MGRNPVRNTTQHPHPAATQHPHATPTPHPHTTTPHPTHLAAALFALLGVAALSGCPASGYGDDDDAYWGDDDDAAPIGDEEDPAPVSDDVDDVDDTICDEAPEEPVTFYVSADDSNSQAQPAWVRSRIASFSGRIRPYEFLNYYDFDYGPGDAVRIEPQLRLTDDGMSLLVGVVGPDKAPDERRPMNLTFSLDLSGSMGTTGIDGMRQAMRAIAAELRAGDVVSVVEWDTTQAVLLNNHPVSGANDSTLLTLVDGLASGGGTNLDAGLETAYAIAAANASANTLDRVVLISDGGANVGVTSADLIAQHAQDAEADGIYLMAVGSGNLQERLMDTVTDLGKGSYLFVDSQAEANRKLRGDAFIATMDIAAREVQLEMTLPEGVIIRRTAVEEISEDPDEVEPQHLAPNDAMLYHFDLVDCGEPADWASRSIDLTVTYLEPFFGTPQSTSVSLTLAELVEGPTDAVLKADAIVAYARRIEDPTQDVSVVPEALAAMPNDPDLQEIDGLLSDAGWLP